MGVLLECPQIFAKGWLDLFHGDGAAGLRLVDGDAGRHAFGEGGYVRDDADQPVAVLAQSFERVGDGVQRFRR
jgi:hypothetical protein